MSAADKRPPAAKVLAAVENLACATRQTADAISEFAGAVSDFWRAASTPQKGAAGTPDGTGEPAEPVTEFDKSRARKSLRRIGARV